MRLAVVTLAFGLLLTARAAADDWSVLGEIYDFEKVAVDRFRPNETARLFAGALKIDLLGDQRLRVREIDGRPPVLQYVMSSRRETGAAIVSMGHHKIKVAVRGEWRGRAGYAESIFMLQIVAEVGQVYSIRIFDGRPVIFTVPELRMPNSSRRNHPRQASVVHLNVESHLTDLHRNDLTSLAQNGGAFFCTVAKFKNRTNTGHAIYFCQPN